MVDNTSEAGRQAVEKNRAAASRTDDLGPGTAGHTISGAAYRGMEVADNTGEATPAERGFSNTRGGKLDNGGPA